MTDNEQDKKQKKPESVLHGLCSCCATLYCCGYACCCCVSRDSEGKPLLGNGSNGKYSVPKGQELQSMDMQFPSTHSLGGESSPWSSERQSEASDIPHLEDVEPDTELGLPITKQPYSTERRLSWKLHSESNDQASFTIQIRQQENQ